MSPFWGNLVGAGIAMMLLVFLAIWAWAWLPHHKDSFDALARMPMDDVDRDAAGGDGR